MMAAGRCMLRQCLFVLLTTAALAQSPDVDVGDQHVVRLDLSADQLDLLNQSVEKALAYLAAVQNPDGSFAAPPNGQPGISSLCALAFLSAGSTPGTGPHGALLDRAIDFVLNTQQEDGLFSLIKPGGVYQPNNAAHAALYNHAIAGILLGEVYGMTSPTRNRQIAEGLPRAIERSRKYQTSNKRRADDIGGWKYSRRSPHTPADSDLSVTAWQIMFLRSAKNAGFDVPAVYAHDAVAYVQRCFDARREEFLYGIREPRPYTSRGVVGAGIFALALGGQHGQDSARLAADRLVKQRFDYNVVHTPYEQYHYTIYHCSQAMYQLGGKYWATFFPPLLETLAESQHPDGSWQPSPGWEPYGRAYTVALTVLALTPHYQVLPIYQR